MELDSLLDFDIELDFGKTYEANPGLIDNLLKHNSPKGTWIVEGYASTSDLDAQNHIVAPEAMAMGAESLQKYDTVLFNHDPNRPIGKVVGTEAKDGKLLVKVAISKTEPKIWEQVKDGTLSKFSIRGKITDASTYNDPRSMQDITVIKGMELHEVSLVSVPANPQAKSLSWYIEKALMEKKNYRNPGESYNDCVSRKIHHNVHEKNMPHDQAVAVAVSECGGTKKSDNIEKKDYPWDKCVADQKAKGMSDEKAKKICAAIKNRTVAHMVEKWGMATSESDAIEKITKKMETDLMYEYAWDRFLALQGNLQKSIDCGCNDCLKKATTYKESDNPIAGAISNLEKAVDSLESGDKDQVNAIIRTLQAIAGKIYQKDIKGGKIVEDEIKKEDVVEDEVKKSDETKDEPIVKEQKVTLDVSALSGVISQLQDMVKSVTQKSDEVKAEKDEVSKAKAEITEVKDSIVKMVSDLNAIVKEIPLRKGQVAEKEEDRTKDTVLKKELSDDEDFQKMNPSDQLHKLIGTLAV